MLAGGWRVWFSFFDEVVSVGWVRRWVEQKTGSWMSAHCWVLRGHPVWVFLLAPGLDRLTRPVVVGVVVVVVGWGVVVC